MRGKDEQNANLSRLIGFFYCIGFISEEKRFILII